MSNNEKKCILHLQDWREKGPLDDLNGRWHLTPSEKEYQKVTDAGFSIVACINWPKKKQIQNI